MNNKVPSTPVKQRTESNNESKVGQKPPKQSQPQDRQKGKKRIRIDPSKAKDRCEQTKDTSLEGQKPRGNQAYGSSKQPNNSHSRESQERVSLEKGPNSKDSLQSTITGREDGNTFVAGKKLPGHRDLQSRRQRAEVQHYVSAKLTVERNGGKRSRLPQKCGAVAPAGLGLLTHGNSVTSVG